MFGSVYDTICQKTKPWSQAMFSMQGTSFHHSHTKGKRVCGDVIFPNQFQRYEAK
ncbi:hypothetical protein [Bacillus sp. 2SH]|uniref:hypothetical protein n=1 Tax=Bacillus sp. 2SH TaxID=2502202 RepID=UPI00148532ED|nr:hypothetical protein [Bacillus sp. 2SH]